MILLEERCPQDALHSEAVLHVRRHLRRRIKTKKDAQKDLQMIFNLDDSEAESIDLAGCLKEPDPLRAAVQQIGRNRGVKSVSLAYDKAFVLRCRSWLLKRKQSEPAFTKIIATDLRTLMALSKALDLACPEWAGVDHERIGPPILILGETGTGKELLASAIHEIWCRQKDRSQKSLTMKVLHVAGMPPDVITDELFGHVKGAYTNAIHDRKGRLEEASGSTLLIDEVGDLPPAAQVQLLRFLQDQKLSRIGDNEVRPVQVRILAATLHDLENLVKEHKFRLDLLHRLRVGQIRLPALREREDALDDVVPLMLNQLGQQKRSKITRSALDAMAGHDWPGNLRELDGVLRAGLISSQGDTIRLEDLPAHLQVPYLRRPAAARIPGILLDDLDEQPANPSVLKERVTYASTVLDEDLTKSSAATGHWSRLGDLLRSIPDSGAEHTQTIGELEALTEIEKRQQMLERKKVIWSELGSTNSLKAYAPYIEAEIRRLDKDLGQVAKKFQQAAVGEQDLISKSPWLRLFIELEDHPVRQHIPNWGALIQSLVTLIGLLSAVLPEAVSGLRNVLMRGGLDELRTAILDQIKAKQSADVLQAECEADENIDRKYARWPKERWVEIVKKYSSWAEINHNERIDPQTIKKYCKKHNIQPEWVLVR